MYIDNLSIELLNINNDPIVLNVCIIIYHFPINCKLKNNIVMGISLYLGRK